MLILKKNGRSKKNVKEATEILKKFGISSSDNVTRRLIREGKLKAQATGDKHEGYEILEKDIYKLVCDKIPQMAEYFPLLETLEEKSTPNTEEK